MNRETMIFFLAVCIAALICVILYQQFVFRTGIQIKLEQAAGKLKEILDTDSDERVMIFTENQALMDLATQINRLLEDRKKAKVEFRRTELSSKKMLSNISHDIKTPMTVILGYLEIMRLKAESEDKMLGKVEQKAQQVMGLIDQFFTLAKLEAGDMDITCSHLNINEVCRESILDFYELLTKRGFQVDIHIPEAAVYAQGNQEALQRILFNLISNAIRYGADGKYLGVSLRVDDEAVYIDVMDRGKGIEKSFADTIFDRLFTMEDSRNRQIQGNGLGLTIAKNLAVQLGGDITLKSEPFVKTIFSVRLKRLSF